MLPDRRDRVEFHEPDHGTMTGRVTAVYPGSNTIDVTVGLTVYGVPADNIERIVERNTDDFRHDGHDVRVHEWGDFHYERLTGVTVECHTCSEEIAYFDYHKRHPDQPATL